MIDNQKILFNIIKSLIYYFIVALCSNLMLRSVYLYKVFPEVMYLCWILFISLGSTMFFLTSKRERICSVSIPFLINLGLLLYAVCMSKGFPHQLSQEVLKNWNYLHYLNLHFLLAPILMKESMYYLRYVVILIMPSVLLYVGMMLSNILKYRYEDKINSISLTKE